jgi:hypothetical protein
MAKKLISSRVSQRTDQQIAELAEALGETKANVLAQAIDREYERYKLGQERLARSEALRQILERRLEEREAQLQEKQALEQAAVRIVQILQAMDQETDAGKLHELTQALGKARETFQNLKADPLLKMDTP